MNGVTFEIPGANLPEPTFLSLDETNLRTSEVQGICVNTVAQAGILQIGDRSESISVLRAIALQRKEDHPYAGDVFFESYLIFDRPFPAFIDANDDDSIVVTHRWNACPIISVGCIRITSAGAAAQVVIGTGRTHRSESRIKHIRQYKSRLPLPPACP
ncbi:spore germination protein GerPE [Paenibacillus xylaniclasticus]|uniref:spore germination protein GerPE n=1 Tax=Paenibacillus xylaniclasticus TaxID=588083 RepID=UPI0013DFB6AF|nr:MULTISPECIES: spore germination protein GerPE [Paenibacillus]